METLEIAAAYFFVVAEGLALTKQHLELLTDQGATDEQRSGFLDEIRADLVGIIDNCEELGLAVSASQYQRLSEWIATGTSSRALSSVCRQLIDRFEVINEGLVTELSQVKYFRVDSKLLSYYKENQFDTSIIHALEYETYDMEEAGKCLALGRHTGSVFHLMRVIESGIHLIEERFQMKHDPSWDAFLRQLEVMRVARETKLSKLKSKRSRKAMQLRSEAKVFSEIAARIQVIKDAWRNPTMHVERRYSIEEALEVFNATKGFMAGLATYLYT